MIRYEILKKIIEMKSFTKAANSLGYTQSAASQMVASLEEELGMKLLIRSRTNVELTPEGEEVYPYIEQLLYQYRDMKEKVDEIKGMEIGVIRMGIISSVSYQWMPDFVQGFQNIFPNIQFVFYQGDYSAIEMWIKTGTVDFGFINPAAVSGLQIQKLDRGEMLAVLPEKYPLAERNSVTLDELAEESFIMLEEGNYNEVEIAFQEKELNPKVKYRVHDDFTIMRMIEKEMGVSILSELMTRDSHYNIKMVSLQPKLYRSIAIGYKKKAGLSIAARKFIEYISKQMEG